MTLEEKANKIEEFCNSYKSGCDEICKGCPLLPTFEAEGCYMKDEFVEKHYDILFGDKPIISDNVNHPDHYQGKHECLDEMIALFGLEAVKHFCMCNVYKYRFRAARKNGAEDLNKADNYMEILMNLEAGKPWK
jgi:hypothetical protein